MKLWKITLVLIFLWGCAQDGENHSQKVPVERLSFRLSDGSPLSSPVYDERSPQMVQHPSGYLSLLFVSNRPCNNGIQSCPEGYYRIFMSRSLAPYTGRSLPAFSIPLTIKNSNNFPIAQKETPFIIAAHAEGENLVVYSKASALLVQTQVNAEAIATSENYSNSGNFELLGIQEYDGNKLYLRLANKLYYKAFANSLSDGTLGSPLPYYANTAHTLNGNISGVPLDLYKSGIPFFNSDDSGLLLGVNSANGGLGHLSFYLGILRNLMDMREIDVVKTNHSGHELFIFSGQSYRNGDATFDLYVVSSHKVRELWQLGLKEWDGFDFSDVAEVQLYRAFVTSYNYNGQFGSNATAETADNFCNDDPNKPASGNFKAFVFGIGDFNRPGSAYNQILKPLTVYYLTDGITPFFSTDANSRISFIYTENPTPFWTGLNAHYNLGDSCVETGNSWRYSGTAASGITWKLSPIGPYFPTESSVSCNTATPLLCVEQ